MLDLTAVCRATEMAQNESTNGTNGANGTNGHQRQPTHPDLLKVEYSDGYYTSRAVSQVDLPPDATFAPIKESTSTGKRTYATVQASKTSDIELNSDLVYCNHSCEPSLVFDMSRMEVRVGDKPLKKGQDLTFFYPSTEWDMSQPFECTCGSPKGVCVGTVRGAKYMSPDVLKRYWLNPHIEELLAQERPN